MSEISIELLLAEMKNNDLELDKLDVRINKLKLDNIKLEMAISKFVKSVHKNKTRRVRKRVVNKKSN